MHGNILEKTFYILTDTTGTVEPSQKTTYGPVYTTYYKWDKGHNAFIPVRRTFKETDNILKKKIEYTQVWDTLQGKFFYTSMNEKYLNPLDSTTVDADYIRDSTTQMWRGTFRVTVRENKNYYFQEEKWSVALNNWFGLTRIQVYFAGNHTGRIKDNYDSIAAKWIPYEKDDTAWNADKTHATETQYLWDPNVNNWMGWGQFQYKYDNVNHIVTKFGGDWNFLSKAFIMTSAYINKFDSKGNNIGYEFDESTDGKTWTMVTKEIFSYTFNGNQLMTYHRIVYNNDGTFYSSDIDSNFYGSNGKRSATIFYRWSTGQKNWIISRRQYTYNASNLITEEKDNTWNFTTNTWGFDSYTRYTYDMYDRLTRKWSFYLGHNQDDDRYYFGLPTSFRETRTDFLCAVYPNPTRSFVNFLIENPDHADGNMIIYNTAGKEIYRLDKIVFTAGANTISWQPGPDLSPGLYLYSISTGSGKFNGKILLEK
jgi:hypothetical protein